MGHQTAFSISMASTYAVFISDVTQHLPQKAGHHCYVHTEAEHKGPVWQQAERTIAEFLEKVLPEIVTDITLE